ncbi:MAG: hypothetical protein AAFQ40_04945 [Cyanobacteria bacterium J06623_5]
MIALLRGFFIVVFCHVGYCFATMGIVSIPFVQDVIVANSPNDPYAPLSVIILAIMATGIVQFLYVVPLYRHFNRRGSSSAEGVALAALLTLALSGTCFASMF